MPKMNWNGVEESAGGSFEQLEPGGYVCVITRVEHVPEKQYVRIYWDVKEGPRAGINASSQWPPADIMSYKERALPMAKHKLHVLADANPGFKSSVAFDNDDWAAFEGKLFGAVIRKRLYTRRDGTDGEGIEVGAWKRPDEIRAGQWKPMAPRDTRTGGTHAEAPAPTATYDAAKADVYDDDIPF